MPAQRAYFVSQAVVQVMEVDVFFSWTAKWSDLLSEERHFEGQAFFKIGFRHRVQQLAALLIKAKDVPFCN